MNSDPGHPLIATSRRGVHGDDDSVRDHAKRAGRTGDGQPHVRNKAGFDSGLSIGHRSSVSDPTRRSGEKGDDEHTSAAIIDAACAAELENH